MSESKAVQKIIERCKRRDLLQGDMLNHIHRSGAQDLSSSQPIMKLAPEIVENASKALRQGHTHYVPEPGIEPLRDALVKYLQTVGLTGYQKTNAFVTAGVQESRFLAVQAIGPLFGRIAMPEVVHPGVRKAVDVRRADVRLLTVDRESGMLPTLESIREALHNGYQLVYLESPVRLTGAAFGAAAVEEIAKLIEEFDATVVWDQGMAVWTPGSEFVSLGAKGPVARRVVCLGEAWPGVGLGTRFIGYVAVSEEWLERIRSLKQNISICTSTPSQFLALETSHIYGRIQTAKLEVLSSRWKRVQRLANELGVCALSGITMSTMALQVAKPERAKATLRDEGFCFADGRSFGAPDVVRFAVSADETTAEALRLVAELNT